MGLDGEGSGDDLKSMVRIYDWKTIFPIKNKKNYYNPTERKEGYEQSFNKHLTNDKLYENMFCLLTYWKNMLKTN